MQIIHKCQVIIGDLCVTLCNIPHILFIIFIGLACLLVLPRIQVLPHALISSNGTMAKSWRNPTDPMVQPDKKPARGEDPESSWAKLLVHWFPQYAVFTSWLVDESMNMMNIDIQTAIDCQHMLKLWVYVFVIQHILGYNGICQQILKDPQRIQERAVPGPHRNCRVLR